jgi:hypothetical protein
MWFRRLIEKVIPALEKTHLIWLPVSSKLIDRPMSEKVLFWKWSFIIWVATLALIVLLPSPFGVILGVGINAWWITRWNLHLKMV